MMPSNFDSRQKREDKLKTAKIGSRSDLLTPDSFGMDTSLQSSSVPSTPEQPSKLTKLSSSPLQRDADMIPGLLQDLDVMKRRFQQMEMRNEALTKTNVEQSRQIAKLLKNTTSDTSRRAQVPQNSSLPNLPISPIRENPQNEQFRWGLTHDIRFSPQHYGLTQEEARERTRRLINQEALGGRIPENPVGRWPERSVPPPRGQHPGRQYARGRTTRSASRKNNLDPNKIQ